MSLCDYAGMTTGARRIQKKLFDLPLKLELQVALSCLTWVLRISSTLLQELCLPLVSEPSAAQKSRFKMVFITSM